jgi:signal transduction histidine kinase
MSARRPSLARRLTLKVIFLQVATLMAFAMCMPLLQIVKDRGALYDPDPKVSGSIGSALQRVGRAIVLVPNEQFNALADEAPDLWFVATNAYGEQLNYGIVPSNMADIVQSAALFDVAKFAGGETPALLAVERLSMGEVRIVFGNGPLVGPLRALARSVVDNGAPLMAVLVLLATMTGLLIPRVIGSSLAGMHRAVRRAKMIDIDRRGTRLPTADVPAEIAALVDAVNEALKRIDDGYERQQRFLADAAHELRTPIAILQNRIELLTSGDLHLHQYSGRLLLDVQRVANLAEQLLDLQRIDFSDTLFGNVDLVAVARKVVGDLAPLAIGAGYAPQLTFESRVAIVFGDSSAIERALINIFQNAIAHGGNKGTILVHVEAEAILVSDEGSGIPMEHREQIFEPFHRLRPKERGAGLGLSLVREIMVRHDGAIAVGESEFGGACFALRFPPAAIGQPKDPVTPTVRHVAA